MIHRYYNNGYYIVLDVNSGAVHVVDELAYEVIGLYENSRPEDIVAKLKDRWPEEDIREVLDDVEMLKNQGTLFTEDTYKDKVIDFKIRHFIASSVFPSLGIQDLADSITQEIEAQDCEENC